MTLKEFIEQECELVIREVCGAFCISRDDILGRGKTQDIVNARKEAMRRLLDRGFSVPHICWGLNREKTAIYRWMGGREILDKQRARSRAYYQRKKAAGGEKFCEEQRVKWRSYYARQKAEASA